MTSIDHLLAATSPETSEPKPSVFDLTRGEAYSFNPKSTPPLEVLGAGQVTLSKLARLELAPNPTTESIGMDDPNSVRMEIWSAVRSGEDKLFVVPEGTDFTKPNVQDYMRDLRPGQEVILGRNEEPVSGDEAGSIPRSISREHVKLLVDGAGNIVVSDTSANGTRIEVFSTVESKEKAGSREVQKNMGGAALNGAEISIYERLGQKKPETDTPEERDQSPEQDLGKLTQLAQELESEANRAEMILSQTTEIESLNRSVNDSLDALEQARLLWAGVSMPDQERDSIEQSLNVARETILYGADEYQYRQFIQKLRDIAADLYTAAQAIR